MSGRVQAMRLRSNLSNRDMAILTALRELRLLTGGQLRRLYFAEGDAVTQARKARAAVRRLLDVGIILRLGRRIGGLRAGSDGQVIALTRLGYAVVALATGETVRVRSIINRKPAFQDHLLAVNELYVRFQEAARTGAVEVLEFHAEPMAWRRFSGLGGQLVTLKPDAFVRLGVGEYEMSAFIEQDQDTESLPTIARKCEVYLAYYRTGQEEQRHGVFPLVWWLVPNSKRLNEIAGVIRRLSGEAHVLFRVALSGEAVTRLSMLPSGGGTA